MKAFVFDTETTGLYRSSQMKLEKLPRVIEFYGALVDLETYETLDEIDFLCDPGFKVTPEITKITSITNEMLEGTQPFSFYADEVIRHIEAADIVIAHNLMYDFNIVNFEMRRLDKSVNWPQMICTVEQTEWMEGFRLSLTKLHERLFGEPFDGAHRAKVDVQALIRCVVELHKQGVF